MKYFPCCIYNTDDRRKDKPAFAILSMQKDFGIEDAVKRVKTTVPENIFIVVNGQQSLNLFSNSVKDEEFGKALTGINRIGTISDDSGIWKGDFKIFTTEGCESVASLLFDRYGSRDLIIDIVNAKYEWGETAEKNTKAFDYFVGQLKQILDAIETHSSLRFFIAGFSRGGMFSLRLARWLIENGYGAERVVVTLDPVQKYAKEGKEWDAGWADWKNGKWQVTDSYKRPAGNNKFKFPILKAVAEKHYNVFERDSVWFNQPVDTPIGSAVEGALVPDEGLTGKRSDSVNNKYRKLPAGSPYNQYDILTENHTEMPAKYKDWVIQIAYDNFAKPQTISGGSEILSAVYDLVGNKNTKELHKAGCWCLSRMKESNKKLFCSSRDDPKKEGYDNCHWCLGNSLR